MAKLASSQHSSKNKHSSKSHTSTVKAASTHPHPTVHVAAARRHKTVVLKQHHRKPYRKRQLGFLGLAMLFVVLLALQTGVMIGRNRQTNTPALSSSVNTPRNSVTIVRSSYGYSFAADGNLFSIVATQVDAKGAAQAVSPNDLRKNEPLVSVTIRPLSGTVPSVQSASQLSIQVNPSTAALDDAKAKPANSGLSPAQVAGQLFPLTSTSSLDVSVLSSTADTLNGVPVQKTIYQYTPKFNGGNSYAVVWSGVSGGRAFAIKLQGLVGSSNTPTAFATIFDSLTVNSGQGVLGASTGISDLLNPKASADSPKLDTKYLSDSLSPAVVKIYHIICGSLIFDGNQITNDECTGFSGSGFLLSSDGYIGTNGHVAVYSAADELIGFLEADPQTLIGFLQYIGLSDAQIQQLANNPAELASVIAKIYDLPASNLSFKNENDLLLVVLGKKAPSLDSLHHSADLDVLRKDDNNFKVAKLIDSNYSAKDLLTSIADPKAGFSSSDVALLKINVSDAPVIPISSSPVTQNEKIIVMGFPGDANNQLTNNDEVSVSVTDGVISSIRDAAGSNGKLYQSDADASHGNSGGPAIDQDGGVIGLLTYRVAGDSQGNAAKSYIRDIADLKALVTKKGVTLSGTSTTQQAWNKGLELFSRNHFSSAIKDFDKVQAAFPSHRLVASYIATANAGIAAGKDVKDFPIAILIGGLAAAVIATGVAIVMIVRHRSHHQLYQAYQPAMPAGGPAPSGFPVNVPVPQAGYPAQPSYAVPPSGPAPAAQPTTFTSQQPVAVPTMQPQPAAVAPEPQVPQTITVIEPTVIQPTTAPTQPIIQGPPRPPQQ